MILGNIIGCIRIKKKAFTLKIDFDVHVHGVFDYCI